MPSATASDPKTYEVSFVGNPTTDAGGCFSSYYGGARHLPSLLRESGATVVSWTRNNVLRQKYSDMAARVSGDYGGHATAADARSS